MTDYVTAKKGTITFTLFCLTNRNFVQLLNPLLCHLKSLHKTQTRVKTRRLANVLTINVISTHLAIVIKDAAEVEEACRTKVGGHLLRLACIGHMLHLGTIHDPHVSRDLKGALSLGLSLGLGLWRQTCGLGRLVLGLFWGFLLSIEGHKH